MGHRNGRVTAMPLHPRHRKVRGRNVALGLALGALVVLFFMITLVKMGAAA